MRIAPSLLAIGLALSPAAFAHNTHIHFTQQAQPVPVTTTDLGDGLYMLQGRGGNIGVLAGDDGVFVIDSQYADMAPGILSAINEIAGEKPRYLVNTHWHGDHTGGNAIIGETGATIIAHNGVRDRVTVDVTRDFFGQESTTPAAPEAAWPVITFNDEMTLYLNGQTVRLIHAPDAHTDGDTFIYFEEANVLHTGDLMFNGMFPFVDITSGGSFTGFVAASQAMADTINDETRIIPGHGALGSKADIGLTLEMLDGVMSAVQAEIDTGKDIDAVLEAAPLTPWVDDWATGFMTEPRFTRLVYADLAKSAE
ncbi:MAG: MBL fold metallo-hydrolase [Hyphomonas sp.]|jgi:cyclase|nr:MBL fold metallo-hydrolase [Henriciella sp.]MBO6695589.1 MBL fold metallo-hydrolase [Henriciella sp.]MCR9224063.1 MBL fold metallo-hydrolase [Hyphomonas sp.]